MYLHSVNQQNHKFKLDKLMEQSEELRKTNISNFRQTEDAYEQKQLEEKKESEAQKRMNKLLDFDQIVKTEEESTEQIEKGLLTKKKPRKKNPALQLPQASPAPSPSPPQNPPRKPVKA